MKFIFVWLALSLNTYMEAGNQGDKGMQMVADVVINRVNDDRFPNDVMSVLLQKNQFSWSSVLSQRNEKGFLEYYKKLDRTRLNNYGERANFEKAVKISFCALMPWHKTQHNYHFFYSGKKKPYWARNKQVFQHKGHYFVK